MESNHRPAKRQKFKEQSHASAKALFVVPARDKAFADPRILSNLRRWLFVIDVKRLDLVCKAWHSIWDPWIIDSTKSIRRDYSRETIYQVGHWIRRSKHLQEISRDDKLSWTSLRPFSGPDSPLRRILNPSTIPHNLIVDLGNRFPNLTHLAISLGTRRLASQNENAPISYKRKEISRQLCSLNQLRHLRVMELSQLDTTGLVPLLMFLKSNQTVTRLCLAFNQAWDELQCTNSRLSRLQLPPLPDELIGIDEEDDDNPSWTNTMVESLDFNFDRDILTATVFTHTNGFVDPDLRVLFSRLRSLKRFAILSLGEFVTNETWEYICRTSLTYLEELCIAPHDFPRAKTRLLLRYTPHLQRVHYLTLPSEFDGEYCQNMQLWFMDFAKHLVILSLANRDVSDCELADFAQHSTLPQHLQYLNLHECKEVSGWGLNAVLENFSKLRGLNALSTGRGGIMAFTETHGELSYDFVGTKPINEPLKTWACASTLRYLCLGFDHSDDDDDGQRPEWLERYDEDSPLHELTWDDIRQVRRRFDSLTALRALTLNCTCVELDVLNDWTEEDKKSVIYVNNSDGEEKDEKMEEVVPSAPPLLDRLDLLTASFFRSSLTGNNTHPDYGPQSSRPGWWFKRVDYLQIGGRHGTRKAYVWRDDQEQVPSDRGLAVYVSDATTAVTLDPGVDGQWEYRKWEVLEELSSPSLSWLRQGLEPIGFNFR